MWYSGLAGRTLWTVTLAEILLVVISAARWSEALDYDNNTTRSFEYLMDPDNPEDIYKYKDPCKADTLLHTERLGHSQHHIQKETKGAEGFFLGLAIVQVIYFL
ncbi:UNVERIFIED_CONTAM: hypothetical protein FKN15_033470 [Acipenser sinensis]